MTQDRVQDLISHQQKKDRIQSIEQWVGIDVWKRWLDVHLHPQNQSFRVSNSESGIGEILTHLSLPEAVGRIVLESTGGYEHQ